MRKTKERKPGIRRENLALYALLVFPILLLAVNVHDSSILKLPALVLCSTLLVSLALASSMRDGNLQLVISPVTAMLAILLLISIASFVFQYNPKSNEALWLIIGQVICLYAGMTLCATRNETSRLILVLSTATSLVVAFGLVQYFWSESLLIEFYLGADHRVGSTLGSPAFLGGYLVLVLPILLSQALNKDTPSRQKQLRALLCAAMVFLILATKTRTSILGLGVSMVLFSLLMMEKQKKKAILVVAGMTAAIVVAFAVSPGLQQRFLLALEDGPTSTFARRLFFWEAGTKAFFASPVIGHGIGSFESTMMLFRSADYWKVRSEDIVPHAHNELIEAGVELGVAGILVFGAILFFALRSGLRAARSTNRWQHVTAIGILCGVAGLLVDNLGNVSLRQAPVAATMSLCLGVMLSQSLTGESLPVRTYSLHSIRKLAWLPIMLWVFFAIQYVLTQTSIVKANSFLVKGIIAASNGNSAPALRAYEQAIALDSASYLISSNYAVELVRTRQFEKGLAILKYIEPRYQRYPKNGLMEAVALYSLNRHREALTAIERELTQRSHPESYHVQSMIFRELGDSVREKTSLKRAVEQCIYGHTTVEFQSLLGRLYEVSPTRNDKESLRDLTERLLDAFPENTVVRSHLAGVHASLGDSSKASEILEGLK